VKNYGAGDGYLKVLGHQTLEVEHKGKLFDLDFIVVNEPGQPPILGLPSLEQLDLIRRVNSIGLWHEIQNRLKNTWFDLVFHADSDSIFFLILKSIYRYVIRV
jgi:hypothetical protein